MNAPGMLGRATARGVLAFVSIALAGTVSGQQTAGESRDLKYPSVGLIYPVEDFKGAAEDIKKKTEELKTPTPTATPKSTPRPTPPPTPAPTPTPTPIPTPTPTPTPVSTPTPTGTPSAMEVKETATELKINLVGDILFDFDKADIRSAAEPMLAQVVTMIQKYPNANVLIEGHTDSKGTQPYNAKLSERRAVSVKTYLVGKGIAEGNIWTRGWGAEKPVAQNTRPDGSDNPDGRQKNRRVEITIKK